MKMEMLCERILTHWTIQGDGEQGKSFLSYTGEIGISMMDWRVKRGC